MTDAPHVLMLGGREPSTAVEMAALAELSGLHVELVRYPFWTGDYTNPDLGETIEDFAQRAPSHLIAKSIGSLVAMITLRKHGVSSRAALFLGVPLRRLQHEDRIDLLRDYCRSTPTVIIQRRDDPTGSFLDLVSALGSTGSDRLHELPGSTHHYADAETAGLVRSWWAGLVPGQ